MRLTGFLRLAAFSILLSAPISAWAQDAPPFDPIQFELRLSGIADPAAQLTAIEAAIADVENADAPDLQIYFDLNVLRLEVLQALGETRKAADAAALLAGYAIAQRERLDRDPLPHLHLAAELYEAAGVAREALRVLDQELDVRLDGGQAGDDIARVHLEKARLADLQGNVAQAARFREQADAALLEDDSKSRSADQTGYREVDVFYATDRARTGRTEPSDFYGYERGGLDYGVVAVTIPETHVPGAIETPSIWKLEFGPEPAKHIMVHKVEPMEKDGYFARMRAEMAKKGRREAFLFVHGFNTRFDAAAKRAAQLAHDMNYRGVPVVYSWPSAGKTLRYVADTAVVRLSGRRLSRFLEELRDFSGADTIHIVAHSMGNRALTDALELLALRSNAAASDTPMFGQIFFAAPDVDAGLFKEMMRTIHPLAERLTLYASQLDWALVASRKLHGNAPRAGQGGEDALTDVLFDTIDMSDLGEDMLAHTYFANDSSALADIMSLVWLNPDPNVRCGLAETQNGDGGKAWKYQKDACPDGTMIGVINQLWAQNDVTIEKVRALLDTKYKNVEDAAKVEGVLSRLLTPN
ncbi:MAG: alpha/beta fold hydrolase [Alphaproteobacteria bacterium]|nr:alpha/beta fold hydrolase [Alphaproteobacteria bacterium]